MLRLLLFCYFVCCAAQAYSADSFALKIGENIEVLRIRQTSDQGYIVCGVLASRLADALIIKLDSNGNIEWSKTLGGPEHDFAFDCFETTDQHYFVGGNRNCGRGRWRSPLPLSSLLGDGTLRNPMWLGSAELDPPF